MKIVRIIPRLDIKGPNLVKGIQLEGLRVLGKPEQFAHFYYHNGADELFFQDTVASLYGRNSLNEIISKTAKEIFIPLTVGGGIRNIDDIKSALRSGADKVAINTSAVSNPAFIKQASRKFGSSTIVIAIEAIRQTNGTYLAYTDNGREHTGLEVTEWARRVEELGAGELVITSVDNEGTGIGFDIELTSIVSSAVSIPVIAHGGANGPEDVVKVIKDGNADGVAIASILHYDFIARANVFSDKFDEEGNISFLKARKSFGKIKPTTIQDIRAELIRENILTRK
jgi:cyclase